ncbi:dimethyladenosine transferase [Artemisia annua]|uniref:Dimethyladenosine transferase n=1 Tax=Artemisia annua TaxID=35608 RepID=A0A2U1PZT7_ARTAN|nr:dimethyladenosine transferase [Artemisia annua]
MAVLKQGEYEDKRSSKLAQADFMHLLSLFNQAGEQSSTPVLPPGSQCAVPTGVILLGLDRTPGLFLYCFNSLGVLEFGVYLGFGALFMKPVSWLGNLILGGGTAMAVFEFWFQICKPELMVAAKCGVLFPCCVSGP